MGESFLNGSGLGLATELGNWTPVISSSLTTKPTISEYREYQQQGIYYLIGKLVFIECRVSFKCTNIGEGTPCVSGLPFPIYSNVPNIFAGFSITNHSYACSTPVPLLKLTAGVVSLNTSVILGEPEGEPATTWLLYDDTNWQTIAFSGCYLKA